MLLLQEAAAGVAHPLSGTVAEYIWLVPLFPLIGFLINGYLSLTAATTLGPANPTAHHAHHDDSHGHGDPGHGHDAHHHEPAVHRHAGLVSLVGPAVLFASFALTVAIFVGLAGAHAEAPFVRTLFSWMPAGALAIHAALQVDQLSMIMTLVVTGVGFLIHVFSVGYMREDPGYPRYFAYLNLFVFFMLVLVLGANYPVMFVGWEGVGLCSYLLIGFWFSDKANADAGKKAFIVNRIGDFGFLVAMFLLFAHLGTLDFAGVNASAAQLSPLVVTAICLFLFLGCTGKSAQIPLHVWLPDAMAGPTPVSALIHAATMVTAGVYLVARSSVLFSMSPVASLTVALVGAVTALFAATIGLKQWDIKKVLAYSTVSQLGYMFVGVGVGAYAAGVFHLVTHAFFKALLFLGSGSVIYAMHRAYHHTGSPEDAQDMRNMGGLKQYMPTTAMLMWIATLAIAGIPPLAGFFSKDEILGSVFARTHGSTLADASWLGIPGGALLYAIWVMGLAAALLTALYMTRMMRYTFHGPNRTGEAERAHLHEAPLVMTGPLIVLALLSVAGGWLNLPAFLPLGPVQSLHHWLEPVTGEAALRITNGTEAHLAHSTEYVLVGVAIAIAVIGIAIAVTRLDLSKLLRKADAPEAVGFARTLEHKYYVDELYDRYIVRPLVGISRAGLWKGADSFMIDGLVNLTAKIARGLGSVGSRLQSGQVGTYAWVLIAGVVGILFTLPLR